MGMQALYDLSAEITIEINRRKFNGKLNYYHKKRLAKQLEIVNMAFLMLKKDNPSDRLNDIVLNYMDKADRLEEQRFRLMKGLKNISIEEQNKFFDDYDRWEKQAVKKFHYWLAIQTLVAIGLDTDDSYGVNRKKLFRKAI